MSLTVNQETSRDFVVGSANDPYAPYVKQMKEVVSKIHTNEEIQETFETLLQNMKGTDEERSRLPIPFIQGSLKKEMDKKYGLDTMQELNGIIKID